MRWIGRRHVVADDGPADPQVGIEAHEISVQRLMPTTDFRVALRDEHGVTVASLVQSRADVRDLRDTLTQALAVVRG